MADISSESEVMSYGTDSYQPEDDHLTDLHDQTVSCLKIHVCFCSSFTCFNKHSSILTHVGVFSALSSTYPN